jgi:adenosylmethionine-8-amino-7-oxononanoate aminotransferase
MIDGMSSWWAAIWGYHHPELNRAIQNQLQDMSHIMFGGFTHRPAAELASILIHQLNADSPDPWERLDQIFWTDSGSVAVEVALKIALQYHRGVRYINSKTKIVSVRGGYHGDTLGATSVCDPVNGMHTAFAGAMPQHVVFVARPPCDDSFRLGPLQQGCQGCTCHDGTEKALELAIYDLEQLMEREHETLAALILEPIVQGAGGMRFYSPKYLQRVRELCTEYDVLLICDEIATGFGRSGFSGASEAPRLFASLEAGVQPDIICLGKAITGGYMTLGAVATTERISQGVSSSPVSPNDESSYVVPLPLMHGPTFMGNPLACAVAVASTNLMMEPVDGKSAWQVNVSRIEQELRSNLEPASQIPGVANVRVRGAIGVIELERPLDNNIIPFRCRELGVWLRPFGKLLYTMPPYIASDDELNKIANAMMRIAEENS